MFDMRLARKVRFATIVVTLLLVSAAGVAEALRSISFSNNEVGLLARRFTFRLRGVFEVDCEVGVTLRFERAPIAKRPTNPVGQALIIVLGQESRNRTERCEFGRALILGAEHEPPTLYTINYLSFEGTLPAITGLAIQMLRVAFETAVIEDVCLITANVLAVLRLTGEGSVESLRGRGGGGFGLESIVVRRVSGLVCPAATVEEIELSGVFMVTRATRVRLI
jgi:hypothetical protein